jgi:hypothetical protein
MPGAVRRRQLACGPLRQLPCGLLRQLACCLLLAALAAPIRAAAAAPDWDPGDVEAADRYRALERERALRFRAAAEEGVAEPRRGERAWREPRADRLPRRERVARPQRPRAEEPASSRAGRADEWSRRFDDWGWRVDEWSRRLDEWGWPVDEPRLRAEREPAAQERDAPLFEPWVTRLARVLAEAVLRAFVAAAHDAWLSLRNGFHEWLDDAWARERPAWTGGVWRSRE